MSYRSELRADFLHYYGLHLHAMPADYTLEYAGDLAANLPHDSAVWKAINPANEWGTAEHLLAYIANTLAAFVYGFSRSKGTKPKPIKPPERRPKPTSINVEGYIEQLKSMQNSE